jgi:hypothetical protein
MLGSVSRYVAAWAPCPVVVVREETTAVHREIAVGRDELHAGEMWNSNSLISWLLVRSGHRAGPIRPPAGGRAPGWSAGLTVAARATPEPSRIPR